MSKTKIFVLVLACAALGLGYAWWDEWFEPPLSDDPQVAAVQRSLRDIEEADPEESKAAIREMQAKAKELTPAQQMEVLAPQLREMIEEEEQRLKEFFAQPEAEQIKQIDAEIDQMQAARRKTQAASASQPRPKKQPPQPGKPSNVTGKTVHDLTTPQFRGLSLQYHNKLVGRMKQRGLMH